MIQRIQSVYLLLLIAICAGLFFIPFASVNLSASSSSFQVMHLMDISTYENNTLKTSSTIFLPAIINTIIITIALVTLFNFKNRKLQITLCKFLLLLFAGLIAVIFYCSEMLETGTSKIIYHAGTYLPVIALILAYMSFKAIMKDDELVKSADRLR